VEDPRFFFLHGADSNVRSQVEEYQEVALRNWLPQAIEDPQSDAAKAMAKLADLLAEQHSDPWMKDFLKASRPEQREAARALSEALGKNSKGLYREASDLAHQAEAGFARHGNVPGRLRAQLVRVYAEQRTLKGIDCAESAAPLALQLSTTGYRWLQAQLSLEKGACLNMTSNRSAALSAIDASRSIAEAYRLSVLELRIQGLEASIKRQQKNYDVTWQEAIHGLASFSQGDFPAERLYQFYSVIEQYAQDRQLLYLQNAFLRQGLALQKGLPAEDQDVVLQAVLHLRMANNLVLQRNDKAAKEASRGADALLVGAFDEPTAKSYVLGTQIAAAKDQLRMLASPENARLILDSSHDRVAEVQFDPLALDYYQLLGDSNRQLGRLKESLAAYEKGIIIAEGARATLSPGNEQVNWLTGTDEPYRGLIAVLLEQNKTEAALQVWEWFLSRSSDKTRIPPASWDQIQQKIFRPIPSSDNETRLVYVLLQDELRIWIIGNHRIDSRSVKVDPEEIKRKIRAFAVACSSATSDTEELSSTGRFLGSLFLQPIASDLDASRPVIVELDPLLSHLPMTALSDKDGTYFTDRYILVSSSGIFVDAGLRKPEALRKDMRFLLMDASQAGGLPGHNGERDAIREAFPGAMILSPSDSQWIVARKEMARSEIFAFIGHGRPSGTGTALMYGKQALSVKDFPPEMLRNLQIAVLSACSSASGGDSGLLETDNLVHKFISAGVPNVIASQWNVDSRSTGDLMARFYHNLDQGETVSMALASARRDLRARKSHPYYWAAFDLVGRVN